MTTFAIRYWRDDEACKRYYEHGGIFKPIGWCIGRDRFTTQFECQKLVNHINSQSPAAPCYTVPSSDPPTVSRFRPMERWAS